MSRFENFSKINWTAMNGQIWSCSRCKSNWQAVYIVKDMKEEMGHACPRCIDKRIIKTVEKRR
jgi:DNA-directed RNA polymerase subunit RPC12/RpoP